MKRVLLFALATLVTGACNATYPTAPTGPVTITRIEVQAVTAVSWLENSVSLHAYAVEVDGGWRDITSQATWASSDPSVLTVTSGFSASANRIGAGTARVRATYTGFTADFPFRVRSQRAYPLLLLDSLGMFDYRSNAIRLRLQYQQSANSSQTVTSLASWSSANTDIATVDAGGIVQPVTAGTTIISATYNGETETILVSIPPTTNPALPWVE